MCATPGASSDDGSSAWLVSRGPVTTRHGPSTAGNGYPVSQGTGPGPGRQNCGFRGLYGRAGTRRDGSLTRHFDGRVGALDTNQLRILSPPTIISSAPLPFPTLSQMCDSQADAASCLQTKLRLMCKAIENQKLVLRSLEKQKCDIHSQLNCILDPMTRMPLEISSDILLRCLPSKPSSQPSDAPRVFLLVSRSWRNIASSTSALWTKITDDRVPASFHFGPLVQKWFTFSRSLQISISLSRDFSDLGDQDADFVAYVKEHAHRAHTVNLCLAHARDLARIAVPFSALKKLRLTFKDVKGSCFAVTTNECVDFLRAAPRLEDCTLRGISYSPHFLHEIPRSPLVTHLSLHTLSLYSTRRGNASSAVLLQRLSLPALRALIITDFDITSEVFASFLKRSSPPLKQLYIFGCEKLQHIRTFLRHVPCLIELQIGDSSNSARTLLEGLFPCAETLPKLRYLAVQGGLASNECETLIGSVLWVARPPALCAFYMPGVRCVAPDGVAAELRKLADGGMEIQIGKQTFKKHRSLKLGPIPTNDTHPLVSFCFGLG
ncbi:hypothetical protein FB45DRAFT_877581 [Roridomyces roridus]|uniref:F-box domain-containing protein n=1 Tax=Roridomyces roridus TaxID=1738132 RepID=A0AAD7B1N3_9AGAR|nr:hypothetical protein FB45DRAFT_877581 [Roridomyces roridus]